MLLKSTPDGSCCIWELVWRILSKVKSEFQFLTSGIAFVRLDGVPVLLLISQKLQKRYITDSEGQGFLTFFSGEPRKFWNIIIWFIIQKSQLA